MPTIIRSKHAAIPAPQLACKRTTHPAQMSSQSRAISDAWAPLLQSVRAELLPCTAAGQMLQPAGVPDAALWLRPGS